MSMMEQLILHRGETPNAIIICYLQETRYSGAAKNLFPKVLVLATFSYLAWSALPTWFDSTHNPDRDWQQKQEYAQRASSAVLRLALWFGLFGTQRCEPLRKCF